MSQTEPGRTPPRRVVEPGERHTAPFRPPMLTRTVAAAAALWLGGAAFATVAPAFVVHPTDDTASPAALAGAFGLTVVGVLVMVVACLVIYRRERNSGALILAVVPTGVLLAGGVMLLGTKLFG